MKTKPIRKIGKPGFASFIVVVTAGTILLLLALYTFRQSVATQQVAKTIHLRNDYREKEDAVLRSLVALVPNKAIGAMKHNSNASVASREPLRWRTIFSEAIDLANARTSIATQMQTAIGASGYIAGNVGDSTLTNTDAIFDPIATDTTSFQTSYISSGINRSFGTGYPPPLETGDFTVASRDRNYPLITTRKQYGDMAEDDVSASVDEYPLYNLIPYPQINFGYAQPGDDFVAKQNWWAFSMELAGNDAALTQVARVKRNFVLSIYEIPSQLAISAPAFMSLGSFGNGETWQNVTIDGAVFGGKTVVEGSTSLDKLTSRRGMELSGDASIGGQSFTSSPFAPGVRETYQVTTGQFFPVSLASESGRVAFVPITRGAEFFDRFAHTTESTTISTTTWNNYSVGALQCAMRLDIIQCVSAVDPTPTKFRFSYYRGGVRESMELDLLSSGYSGLETGYLMACAEGQTYDFGDAVVDLAYGANGVYAYELGATGQVTYSSARFGDPAPGFVKTGFYKPSYPFEIRTLDSGKICVAVYPKRFEAFLDAINADDTSINHSLVVNVDYSAATGSVNLARPSIPCTDLDYGLVLEECADMTSFPKGFSLVTNLRTYIGDDFNIVEATPPAGYTPVGDYFPPCSLFTPEKRYGVEIDPWAVDVKGQVGSVHADDTAAPVRPLDSVAASGTAFGSSRITVNLKPIAHPAELPPITMMNWLIMVSEVRDEYQEP